jgi:hypothetical protein
MGQTSFDSQTITLENRHVFDAKSDVSSEIDFKERIKRQSEPDLFFPAKVESLVLQTLLDPSRDFRKRLAIVVPKKE